MAALFSLVTVTTIPNNPSTEQPHALNHLSLATWSTFIRLCPTTIPCMVRWLRATYGRMRGLWMVAGSACWIIWVSLGYWQGWWTVGLILWIVRIRWGDRIGSTLFVGGKIGFELEVVGVKCGVCAALHWWMIVKNLSCCSGELNRIALWE